VRKSVLTAVIGGSTRTRSPIAVTDRSQPIRSAITVAGVCGAAFNNSGWPAPPHQRSIPPAPAHTSAAHLGPTPDAPHYATLEAVARSP